MEGLLIACEKPTLNKQIYFFCLKERADGCGGETVLVKNSELLSKLDPEIVRRFEEKQVRYARYVPDKSNDKYMNWQHVFETDDREVVEKRAKERGNNITWDPNGDLRLWQTRPAFIHHPKTGEKIWFNQATDHHGSLCRLYLEGRGGGSTEIPDHKLPMHTYYGDGSDIEPAVLQHLLATTWECAVGFKWKKGDLLVLDNLAVQHGRLGFKGERKILVYMTA
ncbi:dapdiamide synthesis protein DdaC-like [Oculina patagonica]